MTASKPAAVVLAGGLGTRMRSATPKHFHPLLGRRMVDWVVEAARARRRRPARRRHVARRARARSTGVEVAVQAEPRGTGDALAAARAGARRSRRRHPRPERRRAAAEPGAPRASCSRRTGARRPPRPSSLSARPTRASTGASSAARTASVRAIVEAGDATPEELAVRRGQLLDLRLRRRPRVAGARPARHRRTSRASCTSPTRCAIWLRMASRVAAYVAPDPAEAEGVNTRAELAEAAAALRDRINEAHMLAGVTIVDPKTTWIEADVELEPDATIHPFTVLSGEREDRRGRGRRPARRRRRRGDRPGATVGPFCYLRPGTVLEARAKAGHIRGDQELAHRRRREGASPLVHRRRRRGRGHEHRRGRDHGQLPPRARARRSSARRSAATSTPAVDNVFVAPVTIGDDAWIAAGSVVTKNVPPGALAVARSRQVTKEGYDDRKRPRLS